MSSKILNRFRSFLNDVESGKPIKVTTMVKSGDQVMERTLDKSKVIDALKSRVYVSVMFRADTQFGFSLAPRQVLCTTDIGVVVDIWGNLTEVPFLDPSINYFTISRGTKQDWGTGDE